MCNSRPTSTLNILFILFILFILSKMTFFGVGTPPTTRVTGLHDSSRCETGGAHQGCSTGQHFTLSFETDPLENFREGTYRRSGG